MSIAGEPGPPRRTQDRPVLGRASLPVRLLARGSRACVVLALVIVFLFTVGQVADRYIFGTSFSAYDQLSRVGLVWMTFVGFALGVWERVNIRVELLEHFLPRRVLDAISFLLGLTMAAVAILVLVEGWRLLDVGAYQGIMGTPFTYVIVYAGLLVGMALLVVFLVARLIEIATGTRLDPDAYGTDYDHH